MEISAGLNKKYLSLFIDSVEFISEAEGLDELKSSRFYRASIISNVLAVECAANICIHSMELPKELHDHIEKLSVVWKFDYFSHAKSGRVIDRSINEYSNLKQLVAIRNDYVHPKVEMGEYEEEHGRFKFGHKKAFNLSNDIRRWNKEDATSLLCAHVEFMNYYLVHLCGFTRGQSNTLLTVFEEKISQELHETWIQIGTELMGKILACIPESMHHLDLRENKT